MTQDELKLKMNFLLEKYKDGNNIRKLIGESVQLGMDYQEQLIKEGINIVFKTLHKKIK